MEALARYLDDIVGSDVEGLPYLTGSMGGHACVLAERAAGKTNAAMATTLLINHFRPRSGR